MVTKVYLAGPMRGLPRYNFDAFDRAAKYLREDGYAVFSPAERDRDAGFNPDNGTAQPLDYYMQFDLPEVCRADIIVVLDDWEKSQGARLEVLVARRLNKPIFRIVMFKDDTAGGPIDAWFIEALGPEYLREVLEEPFRLAGVNTTVPTGEVRVTDPLTGGQKGAKPERFDLIPVEPLEELARVYGYGATKYAPDNWRKGYKWSLNFAAMLRHAFAFWKGENVDPESGCEHLAHVAWHALTLMWFRRHRPEHDDRYEPVDQLARNVVRYPTHNPRSGD